MPPVDQYDSFQRDYLQLLLALPHPTAVFRAEDGRLLAANRLFCKALALPEEKIAQIASNWFGDTGISQNPLSIHRVNNGTIHFQSPAGISPSVKGEVQPLRCNGQDCRLISFMAAPQDAPKDADLQFDHYHALLENLNEIIYANDTNADVQYVSPNIYRLTGYHAHEVIGKSFTQFVHPDDLGSRIGMFLKILAGEAQATEYRMITKAGEIRWVRTDARPIIRDGAVVGVQGALVDITDLKEIEEALRRSEEKYRNVVQNSKDAIFVLQDDRIKFMNPSASEILGYSWESIADTPFWELIHPDYREMMIKRYHMRLRGETLLDRVIFQILNKAGEIRDVDLNAVSIAWEEKPAVLSFLRDITVHKRMETHLRNAQKMEALGTLSGGIAHNFNNLLMGIHGNASLSLADLSTSANAYRYLEKIVQLVQSGSKLTRQLLEYARGRACEMGTVSINRLVRDAAETLTATKKQIQIQFKLAENLPCIKADQGQIEQVLLNLLLNSADAMPDGGDVYIETACLKGAQAVGSVTLSKNSDYIMVKITDRGAGIPETIMDRIFEPFFTTKGMGRGTGLGLSTAYGILKNHDGDICAQSEIGKGTTFIVYLPALSTTDTDPAAESLSKEIKGHGTVLLIDDEPYVLDPSAKLLEHMGFRVLRAIDGAIALELFQKKWQSIDLVILDLILPNMSGKELYYKFKEIDPQVKVLLSSGFSQAGQPEELLKDGCMGFIQKPYDITALSATIMELIAAKR